MDVVDFWSESKFYGIFQSFCACFIGDNQKKYGGNVIRVRKAPEPNDILWENLGYSFQEILMKRALTTLFTIILIIICAGILFGISIGQVKKGGVSGVELLF